MKKKYLGMSDAAKNYRLQSVLFDIKKNSVQDVIDFIKEHKFKLHKIDIMDNGFYFRVRQLTPTYLKRIGYTEFRTITIDEMRGIKMIIAYKGGSDMTPVIQERKEILGGLIMTRSKY
jgi:hypothetical protein